MQNLDNTNEIQIIRKENYRDYLNNGFYGGFIFGVMVFLISLIELHVISALLVGLFTWIGITVLFIGIGFPIEEYYIRKKKSKGSNLKNIFF